MNLQTKPRLTLSVETNAYVHIWKIRENVNMIVHNTCNNGH